MVTVTLAEPERRNAQRPSTWRALAAVGADLPAEVRGVLLRGEGPSFSAGLDRRMLTPQGVAGEPSFAELGTLDPAELDRRIAEYQHGFSWLRRPDLITVAAVQGHAVGAGFQLALACDVMVMAESTVLAMREPSLGLVPDLTGTHPLVARVGYARALDICLTGRWVSAAEALAWGIAARVVPDQELDAAALDLLLTLIQGPSAAAAATKALLQGAAWRSEEEQWAAERGAQGRLLRGLLGNNPSPAPR